MRILSRTPSSQAGNVITPTIVSVVRNATAGIILAPASTNEPTNGKPTNAGISVILPAIAPITVETKCIGMNPLPT